VQPSERVTDLVVKLGVMLSAPIPDYGPLRSFCGNAKPALVERLKECATITDVMSKSDDTLVGRLAAASIARRIGLESSRLSAVVEHADALRWGLQSAPYSAWLSDPDFSCEGLSAASKMMKEWRAEGEVGMALKQIQSSSRTERELAEQYRRR
jgi:hypothetical protein